MSTQQVRGDSLTTREYKGTITSSTCAVIPILFNDDTYSSVKLNLTWRHSVNSTNEVVANTHVDGLEADLYGQEAGCVTEENSGTRDTMASVCVLGGLDNVESLCDYSSEISLTRAAGSTWGRNYYEINSSYCRAFVGSVKLMCFGHFDTAANLSTRLKSIKIRPSSGTISIKWNARYYV